MRRFFVVGDEEERLLIAPVGDLQQLHDIAAGAAVEIARRLVGENESRIVDQRRPSSGDALLLLPLERASGRCPARSLRPVRARISSSPDFPARACREDKAA